MKQFNRFIYLLESKHKTLPGKTRDYLTKAINEEVETLKQDFGISNKQILKTAYSKGLGEALFDI